MPYEFIGFGAIDDQNACAFIGFWDMDDRFPHEFIGFGATDGSFPYDYALLSGSVLWHVSSWGWVGPSALFWWLLPRSPPLPSAWSWLAPDVALFAGQ